MKRLEEQIAACKVYAPQDGVVIYPKTGLKRGMVVREQQLMLRLIESRRFKLSVRVGLSVAQSLVTGQAVAVNIDAFPEQIFPARISRMCVLSDASQTTPEALVTVRVDDPSGKLRQGMTAMVEFGLAKKSEVRRQKSEVRSEWEPTLRVACLICWHEHVCESQKV